MENNTIVNNTDTHNLNLTSQFLNTQLLDISDLEKLKNAQNFIIDTYTSVPMYRPLIIKMFGVLNDKECPTPELKYNQCKVEAEVHANELIKDLHEMEIQQIHIKKAEYLLTVVMKHKYDTTTDDMAKTEVKFDMEEQQVIISRKKIDLKQLEKKIKYRIMEIDEWRRISEELKKSPKFIDKNYNELMLDVFINDYNQKLQNPELTKEKSEFIKTQLELLRSVSIKTQ